MTDGAWATIVSSVIGGFVLAALAMLRWVLSAWPKKNGCKPDVQAKESEHLKDWLESHERRDDERFGELSATAVRTEQAVSEVKGNLSTLTGYVKGVLERKPGGASDWKP